MASKRIKYRVICGGKTASKHATQRAAGRKLKKLGKACKIVKV